VLTDFVQRPNLHVNPLAPPHAQVENEVLTVIDHGKRVAVLVS
jgi:hypothetical protein